MTFLLWVFGIMVVWHVARAFVLGTIDPHGRLFAWHKEGYKIPKIGGLIGLLLWLAWPAVAIMYYRSNPQERGERKWW